MGIKEWIRENIVGDGSDGDFGRATPTSTTDSENTDIDIPDLPSPPEPGQAIPDYLKATVVETAQGFILSVISKVLAHIVEKPDHQEKK